MNSWLRGVLGQSGATTGYAELNALAETVEPGSDGLQILPFGNGAERILQNRVPGAQMRGLDLNRHGLPHIARAAQEGVACAMNMGFDVIKQLGAEANVVRAGHANMFLSPVFTQAFVNLTRAPLELYHTDGAEGAARAAAWGSGFYRNREEVYRHLQRIRVVEPEGRLINRYQDIYGQWCASLTQLLAEQSAA
jgi:xylulokinase